ncbi:MAG: HEPN domain-containing protein [Alphaproteobacteria bacterium]|nr:HEPN domain-containing protein [Alphaproteobacteria bacterium]
MNNSILVDSWIEKGNHDLGTAKLIFLHIKDYKDTICFHCQQAVEKYLKAVLIALDIEFEYKHNLIYLFNLLATRLKQS